MLLTSSYFMVSAVFHYLGPAFAVLLFAHVSVLGVAWLRIASAAVVFAVWRRPWRRLDPTLLALGTVLAAMNSLFYLAIDRLPLSTVGAIEFLGVVVLAAAGVRTPRNLLALALAVGGVVALTDVRLAGEPLGFVFAFLNCAGFMLYVVLGHRVSGAGGIDRLGASMLVAAVVATPFCVGGAASAFSDPRLLLWGRRGRRVLLSHPVRHRPARDGPGAARDVRADALDPAGDGDRDRTGRARTGADRAGPGRHRPRRRRGRRAPAGKRDGKVE